MRLPLTLCLLLAGGPGLFAQNWQQAVKYEMDIDFDVKVHRFQGRQKLIYTNNSPDTLRQVFWHLYFNAFQPGSAMDVRSRTIADPDERIGERISRLKPDEIGYHKIRSLEHDGGKVKRYEVEGTVLEVTLDKPILPGGEAMFEMTFESQTPVQIRRSGRVNEEGVEYSITQWYPKMAAYDAEGWHTDPYIGREFYGDWGDFDVNITIDKRYVLGATGYLQNPQEIGCGYEAPGTPVQRPAGDKLTWRFHAPKVHDFAWAADPDYRHDVAQAPDGPKVHFLYQPDSSNIDNWKRLPPYVIKMFQLMEQQFGKYPYEEFSVIQGGDGGMEYPMATLVTSRGAFPGLVSVTVHEAIHNWYYGVLATNEAKYPWMDEGFTTYAQYRILDQLWNSRNPNPHLRSYGAYYRMLAEGKPEPMTTHADHYETNRTYGVNAYFKSAVFLHQLSYIIGQKAFDKGIMAYFEAWKFRHPTSNDFIHEMERAGGLELNWYLDLWTGTLQTIDYGIQSVVSDGGDTEVTLTRVGQLPMPLDVVVTYKNGKQEVFYIPLDLMRGRKDEPTPDARTTVLQDWPWTYTTYRLTIPEPARRITSIEIDPSRRLADVRRTDNVWPFVAPAFEGKPAE